MFAIPEQFSAATKNQLEAQLAVINSFASTAFDSMQKIVDLNLNVVKSSLQESSSTVHQLITAKDPQEFFSLTSAQAQPTAEKAIAYSRHLASIATSTQAEFAKATETQIAETNRKVLSLVEELSKNAPAGSENAVAILKSAIGNANAGYDQFSKTAKQAVETLEGNLNVAASQFVSAAEKTTSRSRKSA
ncbi:phasin family protein [Herminiimonas fonticola]|uniref:Phasin family protein n=1 Tax=Herminiimonas fonticola TaxID=303380 RepID=A0A4R6G6X5_9BURK|nr:phasin family protein [Herminiimonas fonticola]RBA23708.1 phasin: phasin family protein [Herminiimonas fonticola]TDN89710.1 phasin family protein [Herminiimonas fonticola]